MGHGYLLSPNMEPDGKVQHKCPFQLREFFFDPRLTPWLILIGGVFPLSADSDHIFREHPCHRTCPTKIRVNIGTFVWSASQLDFLAAKKPKGKPSRGSLKVDTPFLWHSISFPRLLATCAMAARKLP